MRIMILLLALASFFVGHSLLRFANPELTETQLFLKYWPIWVFGSLGVLGLAIWALIGGKHER